MIGHVVGCRSKMFEMIDWRNEVHILHPKETERQHPHN